MAVGDPLLAACALRPPKTSYAQLLAADMVTTGGSQPASTLMIGVFDAALIEYFDFECRLSTLYGGGNLKVILPWYAAAATAANCKWEVGFARIQPGTTDINTGTITVTYQSATTAAPSAAGIWTKSEITFTPAQAANVAAGESFILRVRRNGPNAADTMTGSACLPYVALSIVEAA